MEPPVTGQVAIVTGAGQGMGRDIALRLASDGMDVVIADLQRDLAERVANEVRALGRRTLALGVDVTTRHVIDHLNRFWRGLNNVSILGDDDVTAFRPMMVVAAQRIERHAFDLIAARELRDPIDLGSTSTSALPGRRDPKHGHSRCPDNRPPYPEGTGY